MKSERVHAPAGVGVRSLSRSSAAGLLVAVTVRGTAGAHSAPTSTTTTPIQIAGRVPWPKSGALRGLPQWTKTLLSGSSPRPAWP
ncbi:hypothetical protein ACFY3J_13990 [Streptomyces sp. NPDC001231]|uniref:hypothetical protein n=1 Tax=Streptomyces sp. NPDC001231 TaxID=3364549 RepID=UPI0036B5E874